MIKAGSLTGMFQPLSSLNSLFSFSCQQTLQKRKKKNTQASKQTKNSLHQLLFEKALRSTWWSYIPPWIMWDGVRFYWVIRTNKNKMLARRLTLSQFVLSTTWRCFSTHTECMRHTYQFKKKSCFKSVFWAVGGSEHWDTVTLNTFQYGPTIRAAVVVTRQTVCKTGCRHFLDQDPLGNFESVRLPPRLAT